MRVIFEVSVLAAAALLSAPAIAGMQYVKMPPNVPFMSQIGSGGTKVTADGVDFWTSGRPPRPYQVLGVLMDKDDSKMMAAVGTSALARKVKDLGGDALIVVDMARLPIEAATELKHMPGLT